MYNFYLTIRALNEYKPGHISSCFCSSSNYSQWLFETFKRYFSERGTWRIFQIASSFSRDRVLEKRVNILQTAMHISVGGFRSMGSLYGMVFELILGCWRYKQLEFGTCYALKNLTVVHRWTYSTVGRGKNVPSSVWLHQSLWQPGDCCWSSFPSLMEEQSGTTQRPFLHRVRSLSMCFTVVVVEGGRRWVILWEKGKSSGAMWRAGWSVYPEFVHVFVASGQVTWLFLCCL